MKPINNQEALHVETTCQLNQPIRGQSDGRLDHILFARTDGAITRSLTLVAALPTQLPESLNKCYQATNTPLVKHIFNHTP